jgi:hypothetical protein
MSKIISLKTHIRRWGLLRTAYNVILRIGSDILGIHVFVARCRRTTDDVAIPCNLTEIVFRLIEPDELDQFVADDELLLDKKFVLEARKRGDLAFGAFDGPRLIAYVWRAMKCAPHTDDVWARVRQPYCYSYKSFARPDYRGKRIVPALILYSDRVMLDKGYTHRVGFVALSNFASLAMGGSMDSKDLGRFGYVHWFGRYYFFRSKAVADVGMELYERNRE